MRQNYKKKHRKHRKTKRWLARIQDSSKNMKKKMKLHQLNNTTDTNRCDRTRVTYFFLSENDECLIVVYVSWIYNVYVSDRKLLPFPFLTVGDRFR